jgi:hypothetical protein
MAKAKAKMEKNKFNPNYKFIVMTIIAIILPTPIQILPTPIQIQPTLIQIQILPIPI